MLQQCEVNVNATKRLVPAGLDAVSCRNLSPVPHVMSTIFQSVVGLYLNLG
jgi:hypothetical protein